MYLCKPLFWSRSLFPRVSQHPLELGMHTAATVSAEGPCNQIPPRWCQRACDQTHWICKKYTLLLHNFTFLLTINLKWTDYSYPSMRAALVVCVFPGLLSLGWNHSDVSNLSSGICSTQFLPSTRTFQKLSTPSPVKVVDSHANAHSIVTK